MKRELIFLGAGLIFLLLLAGGLWFGLIQSDQTGFLSPTASLVSPEDKEKELDKFTFESLSQREFKGTKINLEKLLDEDEKTTSYLFSFYSDGKKVTGLANFPQRKGKHPVIILLRGYVDKTDYETGVGTQRAGKIFAENGFVTLAPDFLGFGESDPSKNDIWWDRLNRPVQVLNLLASLESLAQVDSEKIGIWAHSNGGQIGLSILEITKKPIPTTFWAPVSKPFPYSIFYYSDELEDEGKYLREQLAQLEKDYNVRKFSITDYFDRIDKETPIQIHQGTDDEAVPKKWSDKLFEKLDTEEIEVDYFVYSGADHNLAGSWDTAAARDLEFFKKYLK